MLHSAFEGGESTRSRSFGQRSLAFSIGLGMPLFLAFEGGGYDIVVRQQSGAVIWSLIALGLVAGLLPAVRISPTTRRFLLLGVALLAWTGLSVLWTTSVESTAAEIARLIGYAGPLVLILAFLGRDNWRPAAAGLSIALMVVPLVSLAARFAPELFPAESFARTYGGERLGYPLEYWNALGCWAAMAVVAGSAWSAGLRTDIAHVASALVPPAAACLYLTDSRGGVVAAVVGVLIVCLLANRLTRTVLQVAVLTAGSALAIFVISTQETATVAFGSGGLVAALGTVGGAALAACGSIFLSRWSGSDSGLVSAAGGLIVACLAAVAIASIVQNESLPDSSAPAPPGFDLSDAAENLTSLEGPRAEIFQSALGAFVSAPVLGIGPGSFGFWWTQDSPGSAPLRDGHSLYLESLAELGFVGLLLLLGALAGLVRVAFAPRPELRRSRDRAASAAMIGCGAVFLVHASVDWLWEIPAVSVTGLAALAIAGARTSSPRRRRRRLNVRRMAFIALSGLALATQIPGLVKTERLRASEAILALGFEDRARELAIDAADAEPWAASPHAQLGLIALARGRLEEAEHETERAAKLAPADWTNLFTLVRVRLAMGDVEGALTALDEAEQLNPAIAENAEQIRAELETGAAGLDLAE